MYFSIYASDTRMQLQSVPLKGHGNEADFLGFLHKPVRHVGPLHYILSRSDFGFEFAEIFVIEKRLEFE